MPKLGLLLVIGTVANVITAVPLCLSPSRFGGWTFRVAA
jgi:hypothetical protein